MSGSLEAAVLTLWLAVVVIVSLGAAAVAWGLAYRENASPSAIWGRAGMTFAAAMTLLIGVGGFVVIALTS
ncbi:NAD(P) transhydrogenase subunit beta [Streptomyces azureus]|uniref:NAD(P) transhydrogenase subunit beta n=1 Tax=Streptomyces azureus TaxID=146537 RepID=A0A0K8PGQ7_STRAJ|nr:NAD(P) transhydrogenase subunit beta [Streptomyces azureus]